MSICCWFIPGYSRPAGSQFIAHYEWLAFTPGYSRPAGSQFIAHYEWLVVHMSIYPACLIGCFVIQYGFSQKMWYTIKMASVIGSMIALAGGL